MILRRQDVLVYSLLLAGFSSPARSNEIADSFRFPLDGQWQFTRGFAEVYIPIPEEASNPADRWCGYHLAEDAHAQAGAQVFAAANGVIQYADDVNKIGGAIHISHELPNGSQVVTVYYHLRRRGAGGLRLTVGTPVHKGELIGYVSGNPQDYGSRPHLHFGIRLGPYKTGLDQRTEKWFYPGYTTIYRNGIKQCDIDPVGDRSDPIHQEIVSEWTQPAEFIEAHPQPPSPAGPTFASKFDRLAGTEPLGLAVADFDGDERLDIAVAIYNHGSGDHLTIFRNTGSIGQLQFDPLPVDILTGRGPEGIAAGDLNNDGRVELVSANADSLDVSVLRNTSSRGFIDFQPVFPRLSMIGTPHRVAIADFDSDGRPDIIVTSNSGRQVSVFHHANDANAIAFDYRRDYGADGYLNDLAVADIDGDTRPEILIPISPSGLLTIFQNGSSPGDVQASALPALQAGTPPIGGVAVSDLNNDHVLDVVVVGAGSSVIFENLSSPGVFDLRRVDVLTGTDQDGVAIGDLDNDGLADVVATNPSEDTLSILHNRSTGRPIVFTPLEQRLEAGRTPITLALEDVDGDGWLDIVIANHEGNSVSVFLNTTGRQ